MANVFQIAPLNPIRFYSMNEGETRGLPYTLPFDLEFFWDNYGYDFKHIQKKCYKQKFNLSDNTILQILSDYSTLSAAVYNEITGVKVIDLVVQNKGVSLVDQTFSVYEIEVPFMNLLSEGIYNIQISYTDETSIVRSFISEMLDIKTDHEETILFSYSNNANNFNIIFDTGITFNIRVEGTIQNFKPASEDEIYFDQKHNATKLYSLPYRLFTLFVGNAEGIPSWMADVINRVMSCNEILIDGFSFEKNESSEWDIRRADEYPFFGMSMEIIPSENKFNTSFRSESENNIDFIFNFSASYNFEIPQTPPGQTYLNAIVASGMQRGNAIFISNNDVDNSFFAYTDTDGFIKMGFINKTPNTNAAFTKNLNVRVYNQNIII